MRLTVNEKPLLFVSLFGLRDNLLTAIETIGGYSMAKMRFTRGRVNG